MDLYQKIRYLTTMRDYPLGDSERYRFLMDRKPNIYHTEYHERLIKQRDYVTYTAERNHTTDSTYRVALPLYLCMIFVEDEDISHHRTMSSHLRRYRQSLSL